MPTGLFILSKELKQMGNGCSGIPKRETSTGAAILSRPIVVITINAHVCFFFQTCSCCLVLLVSQSLLKKAKNKATYN